MVVTVKKTFGLHLPDEHDPQLHLVTDPLALTLEERGRVVREDGPLQGGVYLTRLLGVLFLDEVFRVSLVLQPAPLLLRQYRVLSRLELRRLQVENVSVWSGKRATPIFP